MSTIASRERLLRISKATKGTFAAWGEGIDIETSTGRTLEELRHRAVADRLTLSKQFLSDGEAILSLGSPFYRSAISRLYYSMYHAMRAVVYLQHGGDDHEKHSALPTSTPGDFPDSALWQNALKNAREHRNAADYDPYPKSARSWEPIAVAVATDARSLLGVARAYVRSKGSIYT